MLPWLLLDTKNGPKQHKKLFFCPKGNKSLGRSPPQELEVGPRSGPYLLVMMIMMMRMMIIKMKMKMMRMMVIMIMLMTLKTYLSLSSGELRVVALTASMYSSKSIEPLWSSSNTLAEKVT